MDTREQRRTDSAGSTTSSRTITEAKEKEDEKENILRLRLVEGKSVTWTKETVNNENMNKKSSKRKSYAR
jgi:hypothetical protein